MGTLPRPSSSDKSKQRNPYVLHVPAGLPGVLDDKALWVVGTVISYAHRHSYLSRSRNSDSMTPLYSGMLKSVLGASYARTVSDLVTRGFIECDTRYYPTTVVRGGKCRGYRLTTVVRELPLVAYELRSPQLRANIDRVLRTEEDKVTDPVHTQLREWVRAAQISPLATYGQHVLLDRMVDGDRYFVVDDQGRVHTPLTTLPREYRKYVTVGKYDNFTSVDVRNCQPLLLSLLLGTTERGEGREYTGLVAIYESFGLNQLRKSCLDGTLYDMLKLETEYGRDEQKAYLLAILYGDPAHNDTKTGRAIEKLFPGVLSLVAAEYDARQRGKLARRMQRAESDLMITGAAKTFMDKFEGVPVFTVHDCLVVPTSYADAAEHVVREAWIKRFDLIPSLKREDWK